MAKKSTSPLFVIAGKRNFTQGQRIGLTSQLSNLIRAEIKDDRERSQFLGMLNTIDLKLSKVIDINWNSQKAVIKSTASKTKIPS